VLWVINRADRTATIRTAISYNGKGGIDKNISFDSPPVQDIPPDSYLDTLRQMVCH
jgi:hypothetical protein